MLSGQSCLVQTPMQFLFLARQLLVSINAALQLQHHLQTRRIQCFAFRALCLGQPHLLKQVTFAPRCSCPDFGKVLGERGAVRIC